MRYFIIYIYIYYDRINLVWWMDDKFKTFVCTSASLLVEAISSSYMYLHPSISSYLNVHFSFTFSHVLWLSYLSFHFLQVLFIQCFSSAWILLHFFCFTLSFNVLLCLCLYTYEPRWLTGSVIFACGDSLIQGCMTHFRKVVRFARLAVNPGSSVPGMW